MGNGDFVLDERERDILTKLRRHPKGLGFNELYEKLQDKMADKTLSKRLENLRDEGLVERSPENPRQGEKVTYQLPDDQYNLSKLEAHLEDISNTEMENFVKIIERWEEGHIEDSELFPLLNQQYLNTIARTFVVAYTDSFDFGKRTRRHLLSHAFDVCLEAHEESIQYLEMKKNETESPSVLSNVFDNFTQCQLYPYPEDSDHADTRVIDNFVLLGGGGSS